MFIQEHIAFFIFFKKVREKFGGVEKRTYLCN